MPKTMNTRSQATWQSLFDELAPHDRRGPFNLSMAWKFFSQDKWPEFREWLECDCPTWRESPSALLLAGHALWLEGDRKESVKLIDQAETVWSQMAADGYLSTSMLKKVKEKLACCRITLAEARGALSSERLMACLA